ncbi:MAG TPA: SDR family oxidoreductase [Thermoleophilaceae bacterium]|jgi:nucleoside-diphosphate-sugar epimerase
MSAPGTIFLTGGSGVLGQALLAELTSERVICLRHRGQPPVPDSAQLAGDLRSPRMGLSEADFRRVAAATDYVVHAGATTNWTDDPADIERVNRTGTERAIELARAAGAPLLYVGTAFVARAEMTRSAAGRARNPSQVDRGLDAYLASKQAGEDAVRDAGIPATIVRAPMIVGDSRSGRIARFQGAYHIASLTVRNLLPVAPLGADNPIDFLPQDVLARTIAALVRSGRSGDELWLTAGERSVRARELLDISIQLAEELGRPVDRPRFVKPDVVDRLIRPVFIAELEPSRRRSFDLMLATTSLFTTPEPLPSSLPELERSLGIDLGVDLAAAFRRSLDYWAERKRLRKRIGALSAA